MTENANIYFTIQLQTIDIILAWVPRGRAELKEYLTLKKGTTHKPRDSIIIILIMYDWNKQLTATAIVALC